MAASSKFIMHLPVRRLSVFDPIIPTRVFYPFCLYRRFAALFPV